MMTMDLSVTPDNKHVVITLQNKQTDECSSIFLDMDDAVDLVNGLNQVIDEELLDPLETEDK